MRSRIVSNRSYALMHLNTRSRRQHLLIAYLASYNFIMKTEWRNKHLWRLWISSTNYELAGSLVTVTFRGKFISEAKDSSDVSLFFCILSNGPLKISLRVLGNLHCWRWKQAKPAAVPAGREITTFSLAFSFLAWFAVLRMEIRARPDLILWKANRGY